MMLPGACRAAGTVFDDVDFVNGVKAGRGVAGQQARQAGHEPGTNHQRHLALAGHVIKPPQAPGVLAGITRGHHRHPGEQQSFGKFRLRHRCRQDHSTQVGIGSEQVTDSDHGSNGGGDLRGPGTVFVKHDVHAVGDRQLTGHSTADRASANDPDPDRGGRTHRF